MFVFDFVDESETKEFQWTLQSLTTESKDEFLTKVRHTYQTLMDVPMPEKLVCFEPFSIFPTESL